jgi:D-amino-acid oxidase
MPLAIEGLRVAIVGCGVSGLTCGIRLRESGCAVTILARELAPHTTSSVAGAFWLPYRAYPQDRVLAWAGVSLAMFQKLAHEPDAGVSLTTLRELSASPMPDPWWQEAIGAVRRLPPERWPPPRHDGIEVTVPLIGTTVYLPYVQQRFVSLGGEIRQATIANLVDLAEQYACVVNCTGVGARDLINAPEVYPMRGQIIRVQRPPAMAPVIVDVHTETDELTSIVPRRHDCRLGGTAQAHDGQTAPDADTARGILARCTALVPFLGEREVLEHKVGLRPGRRTVRVEREDRSPSFAIMHHYGPGGVGFTLSWGCAEEVVALLQRFCNPR